MSRSLIELIVLLAFVGRPSITFSKDISSEAIKPILTKFHILYYSVYGQGCGDGGRFFFISVGLELWLLLQLTDAILQLSLAYKMKISIYCYLTAGILKRLKPQFELQSKKISNDQELIQADLTSCPQNEKGNN